MGARHGDVILLRCFWIRKAPKGYRKGHRRKRKVLSTTLFTEDSGRSFRLCEYAIYVCLYLLVREGKKQEISQIVKSLAILPFDYPLVSLLMVLVLDVR